MLLLYHVNRLCQVKIDHILIFFQNNFRRNFLCDKHIQLACSLPVSAHDPPERGKRLTGIKQAFHAAEAIRGEEATGEVKGVPSAAFPLVGNENRGSVKLFDSVRKQRLSYSIHGNEKRKTCRILQFF